MNDWDCRRKEYLILVAIKYHTWQIIVIENKNIPISYKNFTVIGDKDIKNSVERLDKM